MIGIDNLKLESICLKIIVLVSRRKIDMKKEKGALQKIGKWLGLVPAPKSAKNISFATIGTKRRIRIPLEASNYINVEEGDTIVMMEDCYKGRNFLRMYRVSKADFVTK